MHKNCSFCHGNRYIMYGNSPEQLNSITTMNRKALFWPLAAVLLTACEKGLDEGGEYMSPTAAGQVTNSVLQVRTRSASPGEEATVAYPIAVYVFAGEECKAVQTIGDEGQTLNIPLVEGTYTVYAIGGASSSDYVLPTADDAAATSASTKSSPCPTPRTMC